MILQCFTILLLGINGSKPSLFELLILGVEAQLHNRRNVQQNSHQQVAYQVQNSRKSSDVKDKNTSAEKNSSDPEEDYLAFMGYPV